MAFQALSDEQWADRAYDAQWFRQELLQRSIEPNIGWRALRGGKKPGQTRTGSSPPHPLTYKQRWMVERCFAWCEKFKRLVIRYERQSRLYLSLWHLACTMILLSKLSG